MPYKSREESIPSLERPGVNPRVDIRAVQYRPLSADSLGGNP
jgi:hypothetical protein